MKESGIPVNDLYTPALAHKAEWQLPVNVHYKPEGYEALAKQVATAITLQLAHTEQSRINVPIFTANLPILGNVGVLNYQMNPAPGRKCAHQRQEFVIAVMRSEVPHFDVLVVRAVRTCWLHLGRPPETRRSDKQREAENSASFCLTTANCSSNRFRGAGFAKFELGSNKLTAWRTRIRGNGRFPADGDT